MLIKKFYGGSNTTFIMDSLYGLSQLVQDGTGKETVLENQTINYRCDGTEVAMFILIMPHTENMKGFIVSLLLHKVLDRKEFDKFCEGLSTMSLSGTVIGETSTDGRLEETGTIPNATFINFVYEGTRDDLIGLVKNSLEKVFDDVSVIEDNQ